MLLQLKNAGVVLRGKTQCLVLQLKRGYLNASYFRDKFGVDILDMYRPQWDGYVQDGFVEIEADSIRLTMAGMLRADGLLPAFFEPEHQGVRYT